MPWYRKMAKRFVSLANESECVKFLSVGPWARQDFVQLGVRPDKLVDWGYFVSPGGGERCRCGEAGNPLRVLWVGRMLGWKRVDTLVRAVARIRETVRLTLVGDGPEKGQLMRLAKAVGGRRMRTVEFSFLPRQPLEKVRELMRQHDLYVLASDAQEGWGAVVNEALEEGMPVLGTYEAGASAAMLPRERLFHAGDWKSLTGLIEKAAHGKLPPCAIGEWTADAAAEKVLGLGGWRG